MRSRVHITSFGYLHGPVPEAVLTMDVRTLFRDPHVDPAMRELTGLDTVVANRVMSQDGARSFVDRFAPLVSGLSIVHPRVTVAIGCAGGRHRSVVLALRVAEWLKMHGYTAAVLEHRDIDKPVVVRGDEA